MCELVRQHTSITVSLHWLNVLLMREGKCDCGDGWGGMGWGEGWQNERKAVKDKKIEKQKALIQES